MIIRYEREWKYLCPRIMAKVTITKGRLAGERHIYLLKFYLPQNSLHVPSLEFLQPEVLVCPGDVGCPSVCCEYVLSPWLIKKLIWPMAGQNIARLEV